MAIVEGSGTATGTSLVLSKPPEPKKVVPASL
jgi:hypothetical protein